MLRVLAIFVFAAAILAGCAPHIPVYGARDAIPTTASSAIETSDDISETLDQPDRITTEARKVNPEAKKAKPQTPKLATASTTSHKDTKKVMKPIVDSPALLEKQRAEDERKEQQLKRVIEGICRGC